LVPHAVNAALFLPTLANNKKPSRLRRQTLPLFVVLPLHLPAPLPAAAPGALKLSNHHHLPSLAERISAFLEERLDWEAQQQQQQQQVRRSSTHISSLGNSCRMSFWRSAVT
jgi:hypothetical protein